MFTAQVYCPVRYFFKVPNIGKRGKMLNKLIKHDNDKKKNWHLSLMSTPEKNKSIFEKIHKPSKRVSVLNSLFIRNITDVLSTSDIAPEIMGYGIEITEVKITLDYQIVNVYWQVPLSKLDHSTDIQTILSIRAPQIRAEMVSRNVMGKVPRIFFVRDETNLRAAEFEKALLSADFGPEEKEKIVPNQEFLDDIFSFKSVQKTRKGKEKVELVKDVKSKVENKSLPPPKPSDMKSNILGLNHETVMSKVCMAKKKLKIDSHNIAAQENENTDLFSQVPGISLEPDIDRQKVLKQFYIDRKLLMKEKRKCDKLTSDGNVSYEDDDSSVNANDLEYEPDYFEEESNEEHF